MAGYASRNSKVIQKGFDRLRRNKDSVIEDGMARLLNDAVAFAISRHDHEHFAHRVSANSYGWALLFNGGIRRLWTNGGNHGQGNAEEQLRNVASSVTKDGWVGIILASMSMAYGRRKPFYFEVDYERGIFNLTQDEISDRFNEYFKPIER